MENLKKVLVLFLVVSIMVLYFPKITLAQEASYYAQADIKKHTPEVLSMPEEEIPTEKVEKPAPKWPWVVLGILLIGGAAAALAGGGGGGGGKGGGGTTGGSGNVNVGW
jgi:hypothetical protein